MTREELVGALEIGGTHVTAALVSIDRRAVVPGTLERHELAERGTRDELVREIVDAARQVARPDVARLDVAPTDVASWGVATPGPFDYARGISLIRGVAKLEALYGVDLRAKLSDALGLEPQDVTFLNDADAFLIGEWWAGAARGHQRAIGVTLGTGLGSAFIVRGEIVESDANVPPEGRLDLIPFRGTPVEDTLSRRGIRAAYGDQHADVVEIARRASAGERRAADVFHAFGAALGEFLAPWTQRFAPTCVVIGGSIARSWELWSEDFRAAWPRETDPTSYGVAEQLEAAPLLGAAYHAARVR